MAEVIKQRQLALEDYLRVLRRRWWLVVVPAVVFAIGAYAVSLFIPNKFASTTLLLVEQPRVPDEFVKSVVSEDLNSRLAIIKEQIMSRTRLQPLIERLGLYKEDVGRVPMEDLIERMRRDITVKAIRPSEVATHLPGITISFTADRARMAQQVCTEITSMFISENLKSREASAEGTTDFIKTELEDAKRKLEQQESRLADFKLHHLGQLPGQEQSNMTMMNTMNSQLDAVTQNLARQQQDRTYLQGLLTEQLQSWKDTQAARATGTTPEVTEQQIATAQANLAALQTRYTDEHPDVVKLKGQIARLKKMKEEHDKAVAAAGNSGTAPAATHNPEPASVQQLRSQIYVIGENIKQLTAQQASVSRALRDYQSRVQLSPTIEEEYKKVTRDYDIAQKFYDSLLAKKSMSEMATNLERRQQGEQFRVMDPANLPEKPTFPNRPAIAAAGFGGGIIAGLALILMLEMMNKSIRSEADAEHYLKMPVLAVMPWSDEDAREHHVKKGWRVLKRDTARRARAAGA
jgi:polysaccharide chain length determinant protein (PEP-CTERM system associated)